MSDAETQTSPWMPLPHVTLTYPALAAIRAQARREALEEAAVCAETFPDYGFRMRNRIAAAIRALKKGGIHE